MKELKKSVKVIIISVVAVLCALAIVLGCVFGIKPNSSGGNKDALAFMQKRGELFDYLNSSNKQAYILKENDFEEIIQNSGFDFALTKEIKENYIVVKNSDNSNLNVIYYSPKNLQATSLEEKYNYFTLSSKVPVDGNAMSNELFNFTAIDQNNYLYEYERTVSELGFLKRQKVFEIASLKTLNTDSNNSPIYSLVVEIVDNKYVVQFDDNGEPQTFDNVSVELKGNFAFVTYTKNENQDNEIVWIDAVCLNPQTNLSETQTLPNFVSELVVGNLKVYRFAELSKSELGFENQNNGFYVDYHTSVVCVYFVNAKNNVKVLNKEIGKSYNLVATNVGLVIETATEIAENNKNNLSVNNSNSSTKFYNYNYEILNYSNGIVSRLSLDAGYAKATVNCVGEKYFSIFEQKTSDNVLSEFGKVVYFNSELTPLVSFLATSGSDRVLNYDNGNIVTTCGTFKTNGAKAELEQTFGFFDLIEDESANIEFVTKTFSADSFVIVSDVKNSDGHNVFVINKNGNLNQKLYFDSVEEYNNGLYFCKKNGEDFCLNTKNNSLLTISSDYFVGGYYFSYNNNENIKSWTMSDIDGNVVESSVEISLSEGENGYIFSLSKLDQEGNSFDKQTYLIFDKNAVVTFGQTTIEDSYLLSTQGKVSENFFNVKNNHKISTYSAPYSYSLEVYLATGSNADYLQMKGSGFYFDAVGLFGYENNADYNLSNYAQDSANRFATITVQFDSDSINYVYDSEQTYSYSSSKSKISVAVSNVKEGFQFIGFYFLYHYQNYSPGNHFASMCYTTSTSLTSNAYASDSFNCMVEGGISIPTSIAIVFRTVTTSISFVPVKFDTNGGSYNKINYMTNITSYGSYPFQLNSNGYYQSTNNGVNSSYSLCRIDFYGRAGTSITVECFGTSEYNYDYAILSNLDSSLSSSSTADSSYAKSFKGVNLTSPQTYTYNITTTARHYIYIKYLKDFSQSQGDDSIKFRIREFCAQTDGQSPSLYISSLKTDWGKQYHELASYELSGLTGTTYYSRYSGSVYGSNSTTNSSLTAANSFYFGLLPTSVSLITIKANWKYASYRISLSSDELHQQYITQQYNTSWSPTAVSVPTKTGYNFNGYFTSRNGAGTKIIDSNGSIVVGNTFFSSDSTIYAYWTPRQLTLTLYNDGNTYDTLTLTYNTSWSKTSVSVPTKTGYTFDGFYTSAGGGGTKIVNSSGTVVASKTAISDNASAYANWIINTYSIEFSVDVSNLNMYQLTAEYNENIKIEFPKTRTGYVFTGWRIIGMDNSTHTYGSSTTTANTLTDIKATSFKNLRITDGVVRFEACWRPATYNISYNLYGGVSGGTQPTSQTYNSGNYGFMRNSAGYYESQNFGVNSSYALMKFTFNTTASNQVISFDLINYAESNYDFALFSNLDSTLLFSSAADTSNVYKSYKGLSSHEVQTLTYTVERAGTHSIYVKYRKDVSQSSNYDSLQVKIKGLSSYSVDAQCSQYFRVTHPSRTGYAFASWVITGGTTDYITKNTSFKNLASTDGETVTFSAQWTPNNYTITLNSMGSTYGSIKETYNTSWSPTSITIPTRTGGYRFAGFYTDPLGAGTQVINSSGTVVASPSLFINDTTIFAHWIDNKPPDVNRYTFVQDGNSGYYIYVDVTDNVAVTKVAFPSWTVLNGQDDLMSDWANNALGEYKNSWEIDGRTYNFRYYVAVSTHNNEYGPYTNHLYAYDAAGNNTAISMGDFYFKFNILIDNQGGSGGTTSFVLTYGKEVSLTSISQPTKFGYQFAGIYTNINGGGVKVVDENGNFVNNTTFATSDSTVYVRWVPQIYNIEYLLNSDGASTVGRFPANETIVSGIGYTQSFYVPSPIRAGYDFVGWVITGMLDSITHYYYKDNVEYSFNSTSGRYVNPNNLNESIIIEGNSFKDLHAISGQTVTLTAVWSRKSYNIHYNYLPQNFNASGDISSINVVGNMTASQTDSIEYDRRFLILNASYNLKDVVGAYVPSELVQVGWALFDSPQNADYVVADSSGVSSNAYSFVEGTEVMFDFFKESAGFVEGDIYAYAYYKPVEITIVYRFADSLEHMNDLSHYVDYVTTAPITAELGKEFTFISGMDKVVGFMISENNYIGGDMTGGVGNKTSVTVYEYNGVHYTALSGQTVIWGYPGSNSFNPRNPVYYLYAVYNPKG